MDALISEIQQSLDGQQSETPREADQEPQEASMSEIEALLSDDTDELGSDSAANEEQMQAAAENMLSEIDEGLELSADAQTDDDQLMEQVRDEAGRLSDQLDESPQEPLPPQDDLEAEQLSDLRGSAEVALPERKLSTVFARILNALNYPFDRFGVNEQTRNTIGIAAVLITLILLVVVLVFRHIFFQM